MTRRAVARADADALRRRAERAVRERLVRLIPEPDGMATLTAYLPAPDAVAVYGVLDECARRARGADEPRGMDALRADALVDLILDRSAQLAGHTYEREPFPIGEIDQERGAHPIGEIDRVQTSCGVV